MDFLPQILPFLLSGLLLSIKAPETEAARVNLRGAGASFPNEVYQAWIPAYRASRQAHVSLNMSYESVGSGSGKARIVENAGDIEYAGSDSLLKDSERQGKTDLVMFPTMAGGAVLAYNLPGCDTINLTQDHVVGIYNGTYRHWNDSSLAEVNPACSLPDERILVIARRDKSGTTSLFTEALSSFNREWRAQYGVFSTGVDEATGRPIRWNSSVLYMYGKGNNGMSGLVLSLRYSIGYMVASVAVLAQLDFARIQNKRGQYTLPTSHTIQAAMDSRVNENLTVSLADGDSDYAYPIASYTYLLLYRTTMTNCDSAKELVRYADWFMRTDSARQECEEKRMVPLSAKITQRVHGEVLATVTCNGRNMWQAVLDDIDQENRVQEMWVLAVSIGVPIFSVILLAMLSYIVWQRYKLVRMIDSDEWNIPIEDIVFFEDKQFSGGKSGLQGMVSMKSFVSLAEIPDGPGVLSQILQWPGKWKANTVGIRLLEVKELRHVSREMKKTMLWMRDSMLHTNLVRFYGLTELESDRFVVGEYCAKGSMVDVLQNDKYNLNNDFKFSLATDIANGMAFLHACNVVHGSLTSSCCMIDARWTVKVGDWEYCRLLSTLYPKKSPLLMMLHHGDEDKNSHGVAFRDFWVAPEIIRAEFVQPPAYPADMYSFGIILQEIYTREDPFAELADTLTPRQVVQAVCSNHLRPQPNDDIPMRVRQIMEIAWADNPASRPSFDQVVKMLRQNRTSRKTVLDSMMEAMEEYTHHLEDRVAERSAEVTLAKRNLATFLNETLPPHLVPRVVDGETTRLATGDAVQGRVYNNLGLVMVEVVNVREALLRVRPKELLLFLNDLYAGVDGVAKRYGAFRTAVHSEAQTMVVGLESETTFLDQRCATVVHLAFDLIDVVLNMTPPAAPGNGQPSASLSMRAGVNVGRVVTGVVGGPAPGFALLGEGVEVTRALLGRSEPAMVRVSRNVFSHLEKNLDFVSEEAGWIVCGGMEVESFWIRLRIPKKPDSVPSDHSVDSGVELEKSHHDSGGGESVDGDHGARDVITDYDVAQPRRSSVDGVRDSSMYQRFLQPQTLNPNPQRQHLRQQQQQQQLPQQTLSDISEEDERHSPLLRPHNQQDQQEQQQQQQQQQHYENHSLLSHNVQHQQQQHDQFRSIPGNSHQLGHQHNHVIPTVTVIDSTVSQSHRPAQLIGNGSANQPHSLAHVAYRLPRRHSSPCCSPSHTTEVGGVCLASPCCSPRYTTETGGVCLASPGCSPSYTTETVGVCLASPGCSPSSITGGDVVCSASNADQSGFRYIPVSTHTRRASDFGLQPTFLGHKRSAPFCSAEHVGQHHQQTGQSADDAQPSQSPFRSTEHADRHHHQQDMEDTEQRADDAQPSQSPFRSAAQHHQQAMEHTGQSADDAQPSQSPFRSAEHADQHHQQAVEHTGQSADDAQPSQSPFRSAEHADQHHQQAVEHTGQSADDAQPSQSPFRSAEHADQHHQQAVEHTGQSADDAHSSQAPAASPAAPQERRALGDGSADGRQGNEPAPFARGSCHTPLWRSPAREDAAPSARRAREDHSAQPSPRSRSPPARSSLASSPSLPHLFSPPTLHFPSDGGVVAGPGDDGAVSGIASNDLDATAALPIASQTKSRGEAVTRQREAESGEPVTRQTEAQNGEPVTRQREAQSGGEPVTRQREAESGEPVTRQREAQSGEPVTRQREAQSGGERVTRQREARRGEPVTHQREAQNGEPVTRQSEAQSGGERVTRQREARRGEPVTHQREAQSGEPVTRQREAQSGGERVTRQREARRGEPVTHQREAQSGEPVTRQREAQSGGERVTRQREARRGEPVTHQREAQSGEPVTRQREAQSGGERVTRQREAQNGEPVTRQREAQSGEAMTRQRAQSGEPVTRQREAQNSKPVTHQSEAQSCEGSKLANDEVEPSRRNSPSPNRARSSSEGSRKGRSKKSNRVHPSRGK